MPSEPPWTRCPHLSAGTCAQLLILAPLLEGGGSARPELNQDRALYSLALACQDRGLQPPKEAL